MAGARQKLAAALGQAPKSQGCVAGLDPGPDRQLTLFPAIDPRSGEVAMVWSLPSSRFGFGARGWGRGAVSLPALFEPVALSVHLQDVHSVRQAVQQGSRQPFRTKDLGPLIEGQVGSDQNRASLVALAEDLEQQLRTGLGQGHKAQLIDDQQFQASQPFLQLQQSSLVPGLHELMDQGRGGGESHAQSLLAGGQPQPQGYMGLPSAAVAQGDDVLSAVYVLTAGQFQHHRLV